MTFIAHNVTPLGTPAVPTSNVFPYLHPAHRSYTSVTEANTIVVAGCRFTGLTVNINAVEYWYKDGVTDAHLVLKQDTVSLEQEIIGSVHTNLTASGTEIVNWSTHVHAHLLLTGNTTLSDSGRPTENHTSFTRTLRVESESTESFSLPIDITEVVGEYNTDVPNLVTINYVRLNETTQITCIITPIE